MRFETTNPDLARHLHELKELVLAHGAFLHPQLTVCEEAGSFTVRSGRSTGRGAPVRERAFNIPVACLPPLKAFDLYVSGSAICIRSIAGGTAAVQARCMETMLTIYNLSGKLAEARLQSPWFTLAAYPEILRLLLQQKEESGKYAREISLLESGRTEDLLLSYFLHSRLFVLPHKGGSVLMPFVDYINHHYRAGGFRVLDENGAAALCVDDSRPVSGSDEVFVCYYPVMDPIDSLLGYGFVDANSPFAKSVPLDIDTGAGTRIRVKSVSAMRKLAPPPKMKDLAGFLPQILEKSGQHLTVSYLIIPHDRAPLALRRILGSLIMNLRPGLQPDELRSQIEHAEAQVVEANTRFYRELGDAVAAASAAGQEAPALKPVRSIVELQTAKLAAYQERIHRVLQSRKA